MYCSRPTLHLPLRYNTLLQLLRRMATLHHPRRTSKPTLFLGLLLTHPLIAVFASPITNASSSLELLSHAPAFRVTAYADVVNHVAGSARAAEDGRVFHERSLSEKGVQAAVIVGLVIALAIVVAIASLVTAATLSVLSFNRCFLVAKRKRRAFADGIAFSASRIYLRVIADKGIAKEREYAAMVLELRKRPYSLICAFVFTGSAMAELIPLIISLIMQEISQGTVSGNLNAISIVIAVVLVIVFVELLPLGYTVRKALFVNKFLIRFAEVLLVIWYPITRPIDWLLGKLYQCTARPKKTGAQEPRFCNTEERFFRNEELTRFVELHVRSSEPDSGDVHKGVVEILKGAFKLQSMSVRGLMMGWRELHYICAVFAMDDIVTKDIGPSLYGCGLDGAVVLEVDDFDPLCQLDGEMVPLSGKKVKGCVHWTSFTSDIAMAESKAKFLTRDYMPVIYDCFEDLYTLFSILHHGRCKMALVVKSLLRTNEKGNGDVPSCPDYTVSKDKVYWSNQRQILAYAQPIGVISYQAMLKVIFAEISHSPQGLFDTMSRIMPERLTTQEKVAVVDDTSSTSGTGDDCDADGVKDERAEKAEKGVATGVFERVLRFGTRRRTGTLVYPRSPVSSTRGSLFDVMDGEWGTKENDREAKN
ncbi:hypothetical protein Dda_0328 [Drechslerella dactyloides]|uniref:CNNM transmembrane domain-containing protein n=1 Tax=Drechslerella dactyloides TaxID=74499 RepID=A0AAD6J4R7_DREDA|nr:hypothetical protein Dda_0328 [Drechslerella dactyloides]